MQRRDDGKVADSRSGEDECREEFPVRMGEAEWGEQMASRPWQGEGSPLPLRGEEGGGHGAVGMFEDGEIWK